MKTYRLDELALLSEDRAVQRYFDARNYKVWRALLLALAFTCLVYAPVSLSSGQPVAAAVAAGDLLLMAGLWLARRHDLFARAFRPLLVGFLIAELVLALLAAPPELDIALAYFFFPALLVALRLRPSEYVLLAVAFGALGGAGVLWGQEEVSLSVLVGQLVGLAVPPAAVLIAALLLARRDRRDFLLRWRSAATRERDRLRMREELADARRIQLSMLPEAPPRLGWLDLSGSSLPASEVGGDFYDYLPLDDDRCVVVIGDVAGHGVSSGLVLASLKSGLHLLRDDLSSPVGVFERLDRMVCETVRWRVIVTLLVAVFDRRRQCLTVVTAGHPPVLHHGRDGHLSPLGLPAPPLGTRLPQRFRETSAPLAPGDVVLFYTDGVTELSDQRQEQFGDQRLAAALDRARRPRGGLLGGSGDDGGADATAIRESLLGTLSRHKSDGPQLDDITLVVARVGDLAAYSAT